MPNPSIIDLKFQGTKSVIASFLIKSSAGNILIETGPSSTLPNLIAGLKKHRVKPESVKHVFLTHVHLDHAGAAWYFAEMGAQIYVHPKGATHLKNPEKLWNSAKRIYGKEMEKLWGEMNPIPGSQITSVKHKKRIKIGSNPIKAIHTPGHANHHISWQWNDVLFTGDIAGVKIGEGPVFPPCPPPDINIEKWRSSIRLIKTGRYKKLFLTHFGEVKKAKEHLVELEGRLINIARWVEVQSSNGTSKAKILSEFDGFVKKQKKAGGVSNSQNKQYDLANPAWMSAEGLLRYWDKKKK